MRILALDLSTCETGWAILDATENKHPIVYRSGVIKAKSTLSTDLRIVHMVKEVLLLSSQENVDRIVSEDIHQKRNRFTAFHVLAQLKGAVLYGVYSVRSECPDHLSPTTARSLLGLPTQKPKDVLVRLFNKKYKTDYTNHNEIDAIIQGIAYCKHIHLYKSFTNETN